MTNNSAPLTVVIAKRSNCATLNMVILSAAKDLTNKMKSFFECDHGTRKTPIS
jgi:hypothetical protein